MSFRAEREMHLPVLRHMPQLLNVGDTYAVAEEIPLLYRRADIGFMTVEPDDLLSPEARALAQLRRSELWALAMLAVSSDIPSDDGISVKIRTIGPESRLRRLTEMFVSGGLLCDTTSDVPEASPWLERQISNLVFVELKLANWRQAIGQAKFYQRRSGRACVVMSGDTISGVPKQPFEKSGIGLFAAWPDNLELIVAPGYGSKVGRPQLYFNHLCTVQDLASNKPRKWSICQG